MKKLSLLFFCLALSTNAFSETKQANSRYEEDTPWFLSYKKAAGTGAIIGLLSVPFHPLGYALLLSQRGECSAAEVFKRWLPRVPDALLVNPISGALAACFLVATFKALDPYKSRERERDRKKEKKLL